MLYHPSVAEIPDFAWMPDESALVIYGDGQLRRVPLDGSPASAIPFQAHVRFTRTVGASAACVAPLAKKVWSPRGISELAIAPPNGKTALYGSAGNLFITPFRRATGQMVAQGPSWEYRPLWAPDGRGFVFQRFDGTEVTGWLKDLPKEADKDQVLNLRTPEHQVTEPGVPYRIEAWHPDGERLLVSESLAGGHRLSIFDPAAGDLTPLWTTGSTVSPAPFFGPQDQDLYFTDLDQDGMPNLYKLPLARPDKPIAITRFESGAWEARLSPDETQVLFRRDFGLYAALTKTASGPPRDRDAEQISESNDGIYGWFFNSKNAYLCDGATFTGIRVDDREEVTFDVENIFGLPPKGLDAVVDGVTVIDVAKGTASPDRSILIADGRIVGVVARSEAQSAPGSRVNGEGLFAIPGLIDLSSRWGEVLPRQVLGAGVTTVLDRGSEVPLLFATRDAIDASLLPGPRTFGSGPRLERGSLHSVSIESSSEAEAAVRHLAERGCEWVDLGTSLSREARKAAVRAATARALPTGQSGSDLGALVASIADGAHSVTGTPGAGLHGDLARLLAESQVVWSPAIGAVATDERAHRDPSLFGASSWTPTLSQQLLAESPIEPSLDGDRGALVAALAGSAVAALHAGANVAVATDSPGAFRLHGVTLCSELEAMVTAGATPAEALRCATVEAADALGLGSTLGSITPGNLADLVLLRANPLERIAAIEEVELVLREGRVWKASDLLAKPKIGGAVKPDDRK
ncbi:MAG: amidohydrolase family protein [Candidatus Eisenbacteria bacterium]